MTREQILELAAMVRIEISDDQADTLRDGIDGILHYFENLDEVDTSNISPTARVSAEPLELRDDVVAPSLTTADLAEMAPEGFDPTDSVFVLQGVFENLDR